MRKKVLFLCVHNSARSQMAEGLLRHYCKESCEAYSAGVKPAGINPRAIAVMKELGIDIAGQESKGMEKYSGENMDYAVTLCGEMQEECPVFSGAARNLHKSFSDPAAIEGSEAEKLTALRKTRDEIKKWIIEVLLKELSV